MQDIERLRTTTAQVSDSSPFKTSVRNIVAACRSSPLALAAYIRSGVVPALATCLTQVRGARLIAAPDALPLNPPTAPLGPPPESSRHWPAHLLGEPALLACTPLMSPLHSNDA